MAQLGGDADVKDPQKEDVFVKSIATTAQISSNLKLTVHDTMLVEANRF